MEGQAETKRVFLEHLSTVLKDRYISLFTCYTMNSGCTTEVTKGNEKLTEQEQKSIMAEASMLAEGTAMEVHTYQDERADYAKKTFTTFLGVSIWYGNEIVAVLHSVSAWNAFKSVASIIAEGSRVNA